MKQNSYISIQGSNNGISRIRLNDPDTYNSMSFNMLNSLIAALKDLDKDKKTRVIIIEGSGKGFSAGHNLKEVRSLKGKPNYKKLFDLCSKLMMLIINSNKPVIGVSCFRNCDLGTR